MDERRNHVASVCQNMSYDTSYWEEHGGTNFLDVPSKNVLLATVPKVGCTNWKKVIMFLENKISPITKQNVLQNGENFVQNNPIGIDSELRFGQGYQRSGRYEFRPGSRISKNVRRRKGRSSQL